MAEYLPLFVPGQAITRQASADLTAGQLLYVSGSGTVAATSGVTAAWLGVAGHDTKSGDTVSVFCGGVQRLVTDTGGVTAGDLVVAGAAGVVTKLAVVTTPTPTDVTNSRAVVGIALTTATAGNTAEIMMER